MGEGDGAFDGLYGRDGRVYLTHQPINRPTTYTHIQNIYLELSFRSVLAFPNASKMGLERSTRSTIEALSLGSLSPGVDAVVWVWCV